MVNKVDTKFTWVIKDFSSLQSGVIYSDDFLIAGCRSRLSVLPKGIKSDISSLFLGVVVYESLPLWLSHAKFSLKVVNHFSEKSSVRQEVIQGFFNKKTPYLCLLDILPLTKLHSKDGGFLVNDELKIVVEVDVFQDTGKSKRTQETTQPIKKIKTNHYGTGSSDKETRVGNVTVDVNGFQVSPSQVESVRCIFERHPDFASNLRSNNQHLKSTYMNVLLGLFETLCRLPEELSDDDLYEASAAVSYLTNVGFNLDWLEKKLEEVKEKKKKVNTAKAQLQHMEEELEKLNKKCLDLKALVVKENEYMSAANVPFSFDDIV